MSIGAIESAAIKSPLGDDLLRYSAIEVAAGIRSKKFSSAEFVTSCLDRIRLREPEVEAWSYIDYEHALVAARLADAQLAASLPLRPLHGVPIGIKDVFDTVEFPTEYGSSLLKGRQPTSDADAVRIIRESGAVILGKTTTSEFGMYYPSKTRNPHDVSRSSGVSSSGSAAAVVDGMVPLALGTQHTASTLLPASFCGAFAYKPTFGFTSMAGSNILAPRLSQIGFLANSVADLALFASSFEKSLYPIVQVNRSPRLRVAFGPGRMQIDPVARKVFESLIDRLPSGPGEIALPSAFEEALDVVHGLLDAHLARRFGGLPEAEQQQLCPPLRSAIRSGQQVSAIRYLELNEKADRLAIEIDSLFESTDVLITLSALGEAPPIEDGAGSGVMCMPWSLCGLPTVSLPLLRGARSLPIGVQLVARQGHDRALLQVADWLVRYLS